MRYGIAAADPRESWTPSLATWRLVGGVYAVLILLYSLVIHSWIMAWGATDAEQSTSLPGDTLAASPTAYFTRTITIDAPPDRVWPWLLQMGQDRAGFYSNDWLENLIGADIHNANTIHPAWQHRQMGDVVPLVTRGYLDGLAATLITGRPDEMIGPSIWLLEPDRAIADTPGRFNLVPIDDHTTRLIVRERYDANTPGDGAVGLIAGRGIWDPMHFVMVQRMLRGIKERAEGRALVPSSIAAAARIGWALAGLGLVLVFLRRRRGYLWLLVPIAAVTPQLISTRDPNAALAGFLVVGITVAGALVFGRRWWPAYALIAAGVALVLLLAPDAYVTFGLMFDVVIIAAAVAIFRRREDRSIGGRSPRMAA